MRPNEVTRIPRRHIFLDTEARKTLRKGWEEQQWRCGAAIFWRGRKGGKPKEYSRGYRDPMSLWSDVTEFASYKGRTVLWTHNVGYDVRVSDALRALPKLGWNLTAHNLAARSTWLVWRRGESTLVVADSTSVFATTIKQMGKWFGFEKLDLPDDDATDETWMDRCATDVAILARAVLAYLGWLDENDMGNWQMTGNGQSYATFRHQFLTHMMEVHDNDDALAAERRALWCGRTEAYWHGESRQGRLYELDFHCAYARIAADNAVPVRLVGEIPSGYDWRNRMARPDVAALAEVTVECETPLVPTEFDGRILWPIGRFRTTLWDPELKLLMARGARVQFHRGWLYRKEPALAAWARWILSGLDADDEIVPAYQKHILKLWSRALIGRFAMSYTSWEPFGSLRHPDAVRWTSVDIQTGAHREMVQVGTTVWEQGGREEWGNSMPMVTGYIQSMARVNLTRLIEQLGPRVVRYADTDSVMVDAADMTPAAESTIAAWAPMLRLKRVWDGYAIRGPRQIITGDAVRVSGLPYNATRTGPQSFTGEVWESLAVALAKRRPASVRVAARTWNLRGVDRRRDEGAHGWTVPRRIEQETQ